MMSIVRGFVPEMLRMQIIVIHLLLLMNTFQFLLQCKQFTTHAVVLHFQIMILFLELFQILLKNRNRFDNLCSIIVHFLELVF